jgi:flagellin
MLAIKNNLMATNAARHLANSYDALAKSVERLSSGLRINSSKDDAAGLAVRELVRANVATLQQGARNAQDGVSMLQTAEGAMGVVDDILVRMKELAEQAATDSYSVDQRGIMNAEFGQLAEEITRVANTTEFNGIKLLASEATYNIHLGSTDTVEITAAAMDAAALGITATKSNIVIGNWIAEPDADGWITGNPAQDFSLTFGTEAEITFVLAAEGYSMTDIVTEINTAAGYNAAQVITNVETGLSTIKISAQAGGVAVIANASTQVGLEVGDFVETEGLNTGLSITNPENAAAALAEIDLAIVQKDGYRAQLGYIMNRLDAATDVLNIQSENLMAAESRISDVDVATEMAAMSRNQVLAQAGISMLAQANTMPQMALTLLR